VKSVDGETIKLLVYCTTEVMELKEMIHNKKGIPTYDQRLIFHGKQLEQGRELGNYYIQNDDIIHLKLALRGGMYHFTSGRQNCHCLTYGHATAVKNVFMFNMKHVKNARHLPSTELQEFILQGRAVLSTLYQKIQDVYIHGDIPDLKKIILPIATDDENSSDTEEDMSSDE